MLVCGVLSKVHGQLAGSLGEGPRPGIVSLGMCEMLVREAMQAQKPVRAGLQVKTI